MGLALSCLLRWPLLVTCSPHASVVNGSQVTGNTSSFGGGISNQGRSELDSSTIGGNTAINGGGGILNYYAATLTVRDSTLTGNFAPVGGDLYNAGFVSFFDSIDSDTRGDEKWGVRFDIPQSWLDAATSPTNAGWKSNSVSRTNWRRSGDSLAALPTTSTIFSR